MFGTELVLKNENVCSVDIVRCEMPDESDMILVPVLEVMYKILVLLALLVFIFINYLFTNIIDW